MLGSLVKISSFRVSDVGYFTGYGYISLSLVSCHINWLELLVSLSSIR